MESGKNQSGKIIIEIFFIFLYNKVVIKNYNLIFLEKYMKTISEVKEEICKTNYNNFKLKFNKISMIPMGGVYSFNIIRRNDVSNKNVTDELLKHWKFKVVNIFIENDLLKIMCTNGANSCEKI